MVPCHKAYAAKILPEIGLLVLSGGWPITDETIARMPSTRMAALLWRFSDSEIA
jgi:hypothetical protein